MGCKIVSGSGYSRKNMHFFVKFLKFIFIFAFFSLVVISATWIVLKVVATNEARKQASDIIRSIDTSQIETGDEMLMEIAGRVHNKFMKQEPADIPFLIVSQYVTDSRIPAMIRLNSGVIEMNVQAGAGRSASLMLRYVLYQAGMNSHELFIKTEQGHHTVLVDSLPDDRKVLIDPYFGYAAYDAAADRLIPFEVALEHLKEGKPFKKIFTYIGNDKPSIDTIASAYMYYMHL